jgi:GNAT superfamily N-acetyltransferase
MRTRAHDLTIVQIIPAGRGDVGIVSSILAEASDWLRRSGREMWRPEETAAEAVQAHVFQGLYFVALAGDEPMGTLRFQLSDPLCWPELEGDDSAFVHRLAVRRAAAGSGLSLSMLAWAADRAHSLGRRFLRLDCDPTRAGLRLLYEGAGFRLHSEISLPPALVRALGCSVPPEASFRLARYELELADRVARSTGRE